MTGRENDGERISGIERSRPSALVRLVRGFLLITGIVVLGLGLAVVFVPGTERMIPIEAAIEVLGSDYVILAVLGLLAVGLSGILLVARRIRGVTEADPPEVEGVQSASYPGEAFDPKSDRLLGGRFTGRANRRERLKETAIRTTMRAEGCTRTTAARKVAEGTWTDDPVAATYLSEDRRFGRIPRLPSRDRRTVRRTVSAIEKLADGDRAHERTAGRRGTGEEIAR
ncbi:MAG: DUF7269 family protein [Halobacteriota archaeon]